MEFEYDGAYPGVQDGKYQGWSSGLSDICHAKLLKYIFHCILFHTNLEDLYKYPS